MKVALCLYGAYRHFDLVSASLKTHLLNTLDIDIYACVYHCNSLGLYPAESTHPRWTHNKPVPAVLPLGIDSLLGLNPKSVQLFEFDYPEFQTALANLEDKVGSLVQKYPKAFWANLWSQQRVMMSKLLLNKEYDFAIVSRADILYFDSLPAYAFDSNKLTLHRKFGCGLPCDFWYMGKDSLASKAAERFDVFPNIYSHPHQAFSTHLQEREVSWNFADLPLNVVQRRYSGWWYTPYVPDPDYVAKEI